MESKFWSAVTMTSGSPEKEEMVGMMLSTVSCSVISMSVPAVLATALSFAEMHRRSMAESSTTKARSLAGMHDMSSSDGGVIIFVVASTMPPGNAKRNSVPDA